MTDHVCACAAASPARYRASSSSKAASMSSRSNTTRAVSRSSAFDLDRCTRTSMRNASGRLIVGRRLGLRVRTRRSPRVAMTVDRHVVGQRSATARKFAMWHRDRRAAQSQPLVGGRRGRSRRPSSFRHERPSRGREDASGDARQLCLPRSRSCGAGRLSSSNLASAASRSASSKISQRSIRSPSTVRTGSSATRRRSPREVPMTAWVTTAPSRSADAPTRCRCAGPE